MTPPTPPPVDMSPEGIARRLAELDDLYEFWKSIRTAARVPTETETRIETCREPAHPPPD